MPYWMNERTLSFPCLRESTSSEQNFGGRTEIEGGGSGTPKRWVQRRRAAHMYDEIPLLRLSDELIRGVLPVQKATVRLRHLAACLKPDGVDLLDEFLIIRKMRGNHAALAQFCRPLRCGRLLQQLDSMQEHGLADDNFLIIIKPRQTGHTD